MTEESNQVEAYGSRLSVRGYREQRNNAHCPAANHKELPLIDQCDIANQ